MKNIWENPEIQQINRLPMRSPLIPYNSLEKSVKETAAGPESCKSSLSEYVMNLDGEWDFYFSESPQTEPKSDGWNKIKVPGTWTRQGYDKPHYTNVQMPFDFVPPYVPEKNPTGWYKLNVDIPTEWKNRRIVIHIGSAESCTFVYINGTEVGMSKDTRLPCEFDITQFISHDKKNEIIIKVIRWSDASYVEDQDQWWFGGIHRSVYLYSTEEKYIQDVQAITYVENTTGVIPLVVQAGYETYKRNTQSQTDKIKYCISWKVFTLDGTVKNGIPGKEITSGFSEGSFDYRNTLNQVRTEIKIDDVKLWSSESPSLYLVAVTLSELENGKPGRHIESVSFTTGFKTVKIQNRELQINGKKVYIHGVNRHEHNEYTGKTLSTEEMVKDVLMMKEYNFNAVRTCHYPDDERWYELCDRYGIYVLDEANIENHAYYDCMPRSDEWAYAYLERVQRMVRRDKNHASIFGWSLGNESGDGQNQVACGAWIRRVDETRIVHYEGFVRPELHQGFFTLDSLARGKGLTDLISPMYPDIDLIVKYAETREDYRPIIMCEYSHAMGNANGSLSDYWNAIESHHGLQGGFIWDWIDQGLAADSPNGKYWKYGGDFGDTPTDYDFCLNGLLLPDQTPKPAMDECKRLFAPVRLSAIHAAQGIFEIENKFDFTSLDILSVKWNLLKDGKICASGTKKLNPIKPGEKTNFIVKEIPSALSNFPLECEIVFKADFIYNKEMIFAKEGAICSSDECIIREAHCWQKFNSEKNTDISENAKNISSSFRPELFRAILENEGVKAQLSQINDKEQPWCFANKPTQEWINSGIADMQLVKKDATTFELNSGNNAKSKVNFGTCRIETVNSQNENGNSVINLKTVFNLTDAIAEYPRVGISAKISSAFNQIKWYGRGPQECICDRKYGALIDMYESKADELGVPYIVPQENGMRCDTKYLELNNGKNTIHIQSNEPFTFTISKYEIKDLFKCLHTSELTDVSSGNNAHYVLTIDAAQRGVGTGACGPDTMEQYRVRPGTYSLNLRIW